jgi:hypothetical protein
MLARRRKDVIKVKFGYAAVPCGAIVKLHALPQSERVQLILTLVGDGPATG